LGRGEKLLFTGKEVFPLSPNPTPFFKKSGLLCFVSHVDLCVKKCHDEITVLTSSSIRVNFSFDDGTCENLRFMRIPPYFG